MTLHVNVGSQHGFELSQVGYGFLFVRFRVMLCYACYAKTCYAMTLPNRIEKTDGSLSEVGGQVARSEEAKRSEDEEIIVQVDGRQWKKEEPKDHQRARCSLSFCFQCRFRTREEGTEGSISLSPSHQPCEACQRVPALPFHPVIRPPLIYRHRPRSLSLSPSPISPSYFALIFLALPSLFFLTAPALSPSPSSSLPLFPAPAPAPAG
jgi:hypothetical protein